jgi:hypothetical protein
VRLILLVYGHVGAKLKAQEIADRIREHGIEPPTPKKLGMFIHRFLEYKYLEKVKERDNKGNLITYWKLLKHDF